MSDEEKSNEQMGYVERLQLKWLARMEYLLDNGLMGPTDMSTLYKFLKENGWSLDPSKLPQRLKDKLTSHLDPNELDEDEHDVIPFRRPA